MRYKLYKNEFWNKKEAKELFQILPFYNFLIEKPKIKHSSNTYYMSFHFMMNKCCRNFKSI